MKIVDRKNILIVSPESWGTNFVSKHLYALYLSDQNNVYFLNPATGNSLSQLFKFKVNTQPVNENLNVVSYQNILPRLNKWPKFVQLLIFRLQAKKIKKALAKTEFDIVWSFDPFRFFNFKGWNAKTKIYHTVDFHPASRFEADIISNADFIFTVSDWISRELPMGNKTAIKINHGADVVNFEKALTSGKTVDLPGKNKVKVSYVGNFHQRIDYPVLIQLIEENPLVDFILIGPYDTSNLGKGNRISESDFKKLQSLPNAYFIGSVPSSDLILYLVKSDINLVLFHESMKRIQCNTHKLMAYFYSGKAVLSSDIYEYRNADKELLTLLENNIDIPKKFQEMLLNLPLHNSPEKMQLRRDFALEHDYAVLVKKIGSIISLEI